MATAKTLKTSATRSSASASKSAPKRQQPATSATPTPAQPPALPDNLPPMAEESTLIQTEPTYPVDFVVANNSYNGNNTYCLNLTDRQIRLLLMDSDSPRWVKIPTHYFQANGNRETRYLSLANVAEVHVSNNWQPPDDWEWGDITAKLDALD